MAINNVRFESPLASATPKDLAAYSNEFTAQFNEQNLVVTGTGELADADIPDAPFYYFEVQSAAINATPITISILVQNAAGASESLLFELAPGGSYKLEPVANSRAQQVGTTDQISGLYKILAVGVNDAAGFDPPTSTPYTIRVLGSHVA
jgi:hypothetical protein